jgi:CBS domain-containing protein
VETAAISHRVADFLKQYPPFHEMAESDLLQLARHGRVRFYERHQYILAQGSPRVQVFVIQQGTVLLWDERGNEAKLLDVRGAGDLLGVDNENDAPSHPLAARSVSDVLIYAFPTPEFNALIDKYPAAQEYVSAYGTGTRDYRSSRGRQNPENIRLSEMTHPGNIASCTPDTTIRAAAKTLMESGEDILIVADSRKDSCVTVTAGSFLEWIANGDVNREKPVSTLLSDPLVPVDNSVTVAEGFLRMAKGECDAFSVTPAGIVTSRDLGRQFGDRPAEILKAIPHALDPRALSALNQRARALVLRYLNRESSADWLTGFTTHVDTRLLQKTISLIAPSTMSACWCVFGPSGRSESLTSVMPHLVLITRDGEDGSVWNDAFQDVSRFLLHCGYLPQPAAPFEPSFFVASLSEWNARYGDWVNDPILKMFYQARPLFDLRPVCGDESLFLSIERTVTGALSRDFLHVIANDCLSTIPPLTFFRNAVVDEGGEETSVFRLEENALQPLVDVGRVFAVASKRVFRTSTLERFEMASGLLREQASIFQEAAHTLRLLLWQQGRAGIRQGNSGAEVPPALLGPYDRLLLKKGFRSILRLIEFTGDFEWLKHL